MKFLITLLLFALSLCATDAQTVTMGETNVLSDTDKGNANLLLTQAATLSQAGTLQSLSFYVRTAAGNLILGVYDSTGPNGGPGDLLAQSSITPVTHAGWLTLPLPNVALQPGTDWLAVAPENNSVGFCGDRVNGQTAYVSLTFGERRLHFPKGQMIFQVIGVS